MSFMDTCVRDFRTNPLEFPFSTQVLAFSSNIIYMIYLYYSSRKRLLCLMKLLSVFGLFISGTFITMMSKVLIGDYNCSAKPNSVSGHAFFALFFFSAWTYNFVMKNKRQSKTHRIMLLFTNASFILAVFYTYFGGYHTMRQMIYALYFVLPYLILYIILSKVFSKRNRLLAVTVIMLLSTAIGIKYVPILGLPSSFIYSTLIYCILVIYSIYTFSKFTYQ